jgi:hypothetical protein
MRALIEKFPEEYEGWAKEKGEKAAPPPFVVTKEEGRTWETVDSQSPTRRKCEPGLVTEASQKGSIIE